MTGAPSLVCIGAYLSGMLIDAPNLRSTLELHHDPRLPPGSRTGNRESLGSDGTITPPAMHIYMEGGVIVGVVAKIPLHL